jgi:hypothetical protein
MRLGTPERNAAWIAGPRRIADVEEFPGHRSPPQHLETLIKRPSVTRGDTVQYSPL